MNSSVPAIVTNVKERKAELDELSLKEEIL